MRRKPFCLVDVALSSEGVGSAFYLPAIMSRSLFFYSVRGVSSISSADIHEFHVTGIDPSG